MRILIIEDDHRIANTVKKGLEQEHFAVDVVYDGQDGFDQASVESYDIIILDRMLPGIDGMKVCKNLRKENIHTPILMLTAKSQINDRVEGLDSGADDYLTKPFSFSELVARVRALCRRPKKTIGAIFKVQELMFDPMMFHVERFGEKINLSSREFSLLEYLLRNVNNVVSKDQIIAHVWNYDADVLPNTVEVTVRNIRQKIESPFPNKPQVIETVRGFGYKITE